MKSNVENISDVEKKITVEIPKETINEEIERTYGLLQRSAAIKGFRKGKVPRNMLEAHFREDVMSDVLSKIINDSYAYTLKEHDLNPISFPKFETEKFEPGKDYVYKATFEVKPKLDVRDYAGIELSKPEVNITETDVDNVIKHLQETQAVLKIKESETLTKGDFAVAEITAFVEGKAVTPEKGRIHTIEIGKNMVVPEIEEALLKLKKGEDTTVKTKLSQDLKDKNLAGKDSEFKVRLKEIREKVAPTINDEFARSLGPYKDINDLKEATKNQISSQRERSNLVKLQNDALKTILEKNKFDIPGILIENETKNMENDYRMHAQRDGFTIDKINEELGKAKDEIKNEATKRVREALVLEAIAEKEGIRVEDEEVDKRLESMSKSLGVKIEQVRDYYKGEAMSSLLAQMSAEKTLDFIIKKASIKTYKP